MASGWKRACMAANTWAIERSTFLIKPDGAIAEIWRKVKVPDMRKAVLEAAARTLIAGTAVPMTRRTSKA